MRRCSREMNLESSLVKHFSNFCVHCGFFVNFKLPKFTNYLIWPRWKNCSKINDYHHNLWYHTSDSLQSKHFHEYKKTIRAKIAEAVKITGVSFKAYGWSLCKDSLDYEDCLMWRFCKIWFWGSWLIKSLEQNSVCSNCNKSLKRTDIVVITNLRDKLNELFGKRDEILNDGLVKDNAIIDEDKTPVQSNEDLSYFDKEINKSKDRSSIL